MSATAQQALHVLERIYANEAVEAPKKEDHVMHWGGTSLSVAGVPLLVGEGELDEIIETPAMTKIPGTKPWALGVATHKGTLMPIISGDVFFRKTPNTGRIREYCMVIRRGGFNFAMTLSSVERDMKFPLEERKMDNAVDPDFADFCLGGFVDGDRFLAVLDIDKLIADEDFENASLVEGDIKEEVER